MQEDAAFHISYAAASPELAAATAGLLARLPAWFARPEANAQYVESARALPGVLAHGPDGEPVGLLLHRRHFAQSAEIHLMAVAPDRHRRGIGAALVGAVESRLRADGCRMLQVKTLGPSHPDAGYAGTRAFYRAAGFIPVEETDDLWPGTPCLIMVKQIGG
ncbi:GNAT family N-acetyltransferase [Streptomyces sp. KLOTTS4A1]|uniref:GNAT family N-acetyltransferase n=1 Tax=Streptomyces sp. KLOTTS4A1 TaxID=3390996 RepID=UPI0039F58513